MAQRPSRGDVDRKEMGAVVGYATRERENSRGNAIGVSWGYNPIMNEDGKG